MSTGIYSIGISGLQAAQIALLTTEHNVTNANTPGYTRQRVVQASNVPIMTGAGAIGQGTHVETIDRLYDRFLTAQVNQAQTKVSELDAYYAQIKQIDDMLADPNAGLSPALQSFFTGVQAMAANPSSIAARQSMVASAETLADRFQNLDTRLSEIAEQVNGQIIDAVASINTYASQIAEMNQRIVLAEASYGNPANDLLDKRDYLISELNKLVQVQTTTNSDGSYNVYIGTGQQLVVGQQVMTMTATAATSDPTRIAIGLKNAGSTQELPESLINGGKLGGLLRFRSESLDSTVNELGRVAASLALNFNAQHELGQNLLNQIDGEIGFVADFFTYPQPKVIDNSLNTGSGAMTLSFLDPNAPGAPAFSGNFSTDLVASNYQVQFDALGGFEVRRLSDNTVVANGGGVGTVTFDGLQLDVTAIGDANDKFTLQPVSEMARNIGVDSRIAADSRLVAAAAPMRVATHVSNQGSLKISQGVNGVGYSVASLPLTLSANATQLTGLPATAVAWYSDGSSQAGSAVDLVSGTATLAGFSFDGMSFKVSGTAANGDIFTVERNQGGVQDGRNALALGNLQTQNTTAGGTATFQDTYAQLVANNGIRTNEAKVVGDAQQSMLEQAQASREALSGVNLDEEAANLIRYQQAYQASSKLLEVGKTLFDTILSIAG